MHTVVVRRRLNERHAVQPCGRERQERVLILTTQAVYRCKFDFTTNKCEHANRTALSSIIRIEYVPRQCGCRAPASPYRTAAFAHFARPLAPLLSRGRRAGLRHRSVCARRHGHFAAKGGLTGFIWKKAIEQQQVRVPAQMSAIAFVRSFLPDLSHFHRRARVRPASAVAD
jgi:hypothetical protein